MNNQKQQILHTIKRLSSEIEITSENISIILAAGHGKRIKSETPKMLHKIWNIPTICRVVDTVGDVLGNSRIVVVGIKGDEVSSQIGRRDGVTFVYQEEQKGTGHAVQIALNAFGGREYNGNIYVFPGDMGLITREIVRKFKEEFERSRLDMLVLTGIYEGKIEDNYYGRVLRVPLNAHTGNSNGSDQGLVIEIMEHKDILALNSDYTVRFNGREYCFTRSALLSMREFNSGVYAFRGKLIKKYIAEITKDNVQGEFYITELIKIFNRHQFSVGALKIADHTALLAFNNKSTLRDMEGIARSRVYNKIGDIITIEDKEDFFLADTVIESILALDKEKGPLDIVIEKGVYIYDGVELNKGIHIKKNSVLNGNIKLGEGVIICENVSLSTYPEQVMKIGDHTKIFKGNIIKGNTHIGRDCRIESSVNITGSDEYPTRIGDNVTIKGTSYVFGSIIENDQWIEHSVIKKKYIRKVISDGSIQQIKHYLPPPEGISSISDLPSSLKEGGQRA
jgi:bifunctional UDP-N-acetylglucosamine pyrophosphorylase/glucosamine-1-phosphate N-acetyltransferase